MAATELVKEIEEQGKNEEYQRESAIELVSQLLASEIQEQSDY